MSGVKKQIKILQPITYPTSANKSSFDAEIPFIFGNTFIAGHLHTAPCAS